MEKIVSTPTQSLGSLSTGSCTRNVPLFENSHPSAARQLGQPIHIQSANFGKFELNYLNLAPFLLLNPVVLHEL